MTTPRLTEKDADALGNFMLQTLGRQGAKMTAFRAALDNRHYEDALRIMREIEGITIPTTP